MLAVPSKDQTSSSFVGTLHVVLTGNPNCGKTTLFNSLTGLRAKVGNYAGVTVERKEGKMLGTGERLVTVLDLPGTYSLSPQSLDEQISRDVLFNRLPEVSAPDGVIVVVDASNLERNLYYATQVIELGYPTIIALNMIDVAEENGHHIDVAALETALKTPVIPLIASKGQGIPALKDQILEIRDERRRSPGTLCQLPAALSESVDRISKLLILKDASHRFAQAEALLLLTDERTSAAHHASVVPSVIREERERLEKEDIDWRSALIELRYGVASRIYREIVTENFEGRETFSDKVDRILTHKVWGMIVFIGIMAAMFQSIFTFAKYPMDAMQAGVGWVGEHIGRLIPTGDLHSLIVDGVVAGVGAVVVFLPQICLLFLFIGLLEDTGYMARAAFLMDRLMSKVGLHGKSFIPMLSSFACAIPGIMATRTIESPKDRLVTILVAPLMSCSARLPVYTVLISACIPDRRFLGFLRLQGLTMLCMYLLGIVVALLMAWLFKKTLLKGEPALLIMELPPYKRPVGHVVLRQMWDRSKLFLKRAGTVILGISILLWFLSTYPRDATREQNFAARRNAIISAQQQNPREAQILAALEKEEAGQQLRASYAGRFGRAIEPMIAPLGFDWKIGIGIVTSFAAREVFVSTMSIVYNVGKGEVTDENSKKLAETLREQKRADGAVLYTPLLAVTLMVFYVFALQCVSTVAVVRRETNSWGWPLFQWCYMGALAWILAYMTYQAGRWLGWS